MSDLDTTSTGPTPNDMPSAKPGAESDGDLTATDNVDGDEGDAEAPSYEDLLTERDTWKSQARANERRAKANAEKAKEYDANYSKFKAAYEREQKRRQQEKTPEQIKAELDAETERRVAEAEAARAEAEAKLLRHRLSDGLPDWAMALVTGTTEEEITGQVAAVKKQLDEYVSAAIGETRMPRRPAPNPLAGRSGQVGSSPQEQFASVFSKILN